MALTKRIIPCLDIKDGMTVKCIHFQELKIISDPLDLAMSYCVQGADELVFLDISATHEGRQTMTGLVKRLAQHINIPFTVGGGIKSMEDVSRLLDNGADKISVNTAAVQNPKLIDELAKTFGSQCVVVAVDAQQSGNEWFVHTHGGQAATQLTVIDWAREAESRGAGEMLLTSMTHDGTKNGFALELTREISEMVQIPVIASGGAGKMEDFRDVFGAGKADAALAASVFHYGEIAIPELKNYLQNNKIPVR